MQRNQSKVSGKSENQSLLQTKSFFPVVLGPEINPVMGHPLLGYNLKPKGLNDKTPSVKKPWDEGGIRWPV